MAAAKPTTPVPIILCGKTEKIGKGVIEGLKPEYDVVHFILTPEVGAKEIPEILRGTAPDDIDSNIGSGNFFTSVRTIVTGGAYDNEGIALMQAAVAQVADVVWLRQDTTKPAPPLGPEYGKAMVSRVREALDNLQLEERVDGTRGGTVWY